MFFTLLLLALRCVPTDVPTSAKTMSCRFYSCSFGLRPLLAHLETEETSRNTRRRSRRRLHLGKKKHSKRNLPNECLVTAVQWLVLLVPAGELQPSA